MNGTAPAKVVVLGATGCVGRHVCAALTAAGSDVLAVARRPAPHLGPLPFLALDAAACSARDLADVLARERADAVVNATLGWGADVRPVNVGLVERLLASVALLPAGRRPRLVQLGTVHEYGPTPAGSSLTEWTEPAPEADYPRAKLVASRLVLDAARSGTLDAVVLRMANTIGPHPALESFLGSLAVRLAGTAPGGRFELTLADAWRDYVDVRDAADAVVRAASRRWQGDFGSPGPVVNIGRGQALPIGDLVDGLVAAAGLPRDTVRTRPGNVHSQGADWIRVDPARAARLLGWRPRLDTAASLRAMWDSVRSGAPVPGA